MIIIDTRSSVEFQAGHTPGAINLAPDKFLAGLPAELADVPKDEEVVVYCVSGARSNVVKHLLENYGFMNVTNGINKDHVHRMLN